MTRAIVESDIFCKRQGWIVCQQYYLHLIKFVKTSQRLDPVTGEPNAWTIQAEMPLWYVKIYSFLLNWALDDEGKELIERLERRGLIVHGDEEEKEGADS